MEKNYFLEKEEIVEKNYFPEEEFSFCFNASKPVYVHVENDKNRVFSLNNSCYNRKLDRPNRIEIKGYHESLRPTNDSVTLEQLESVLNGIVDEEQKKEILRKLKKR